VDPGTKSIDKSMSLFGGNPRIFLKTSSKIPQYQMIFNDGHFISCYLFHMGCKNMASIPEALFQLHS
jgi:hypothetical protein